MRLKDLLFWQRESTKRWELYYEGEDNPPHCDIEYIKNSGVHNVVLVADYHIIFFATHQKAGMLAKKLPEWELGNPDNPSSQVVLVDDPIIDLTN